MFEKGRNIPCPYEVAECVKKAGKFDVLNILNVLDILIHCRMGVCVGVKSEKLNQS